MGTFWRLYKRSQFTLCLACHTLNLSFSRHRLRPKVDSNPVRRKSIRIAGFHIGNARLERVVNSLRLTAVVEVDTTNSDSSVWR